MRKFVCAWLVLPFLAAAGWGQTKLQSPNGAVEITFFADGGPLTYSVSFRGKPVIARSSLGLELEGQPVLGLHARSAQVRTGGLDETYTMPQGKSNPVKNACHTMAVQLEETAEPSRELWISARAYDDGVAFRYLVPEKEGRQELRLVSERTEFRLAKEATTYPLILQGFQTPYEDGYQTLPLSGVRADSLVALPLLAELPGVAWLAITEADIDNYAGMYLQHSAKDTGLLTTRLSPSLEDKTLAVRAGKSLLTPWRVVMIADQPGRLVESNIIVNLNPPSAIKDTSWIKPGKTAWDWWSGSFASGVNFKPGMNTATMKHYVDFSAAAGMPYMLIDAGWALHDTGPAHSNADLTKTNPEIDMPSILSYAKGKHVRLWLWAHWSDVDKQVDRAFPLFEQWGVAGVKIDFMNRDDQWMVNFYRRIVEKAAAHHLMIDYHGAYKPDGMRRTWPNLITQEGVMGAEYNKWSNRITPDHNVMLAFTRMLAGPMDYTPGGFRNSTRAGFQARQVEPMVMGTRAHQLALYAVFESGLQMVADDPEAYKAQRDFDFIKAAPAVWDETRVIAGKPGDFISIARRNGRQWFLGSITGSRGQQINLPLAFLGRGDFVADIYSDAADAATEPKHTTIEQRRVNAATVLQVKLAGGGGQAIKFTPAP